MRRIALILLLVSFAAGCGATEPASPPGPDAAEVDLQVESSGGQTVVRSGERSVTLDGAYRHARMAPGFPEDGRSRDGRLVVLESTANTSSVTSGTFALVDSSLQRPPKVVTLEGDYDYDALAPSGAFLYIVNHFRADDRERYQVRAYDIAVGTLTDRVVVDKTGTPEDGMSGVPVARAGDPDGPWIYTLYRSAKHPFVHALDAENGFSVCIDMPEGTPVADGWRLRYDEATRALTASAPSGSPSIIVDGTNFTASVGSLAAPEG